MQQGDRRTDSYFHHLGLTREASRMPLSLTRLLTHRHGTNLPARPNNTHVILPNQPARTHRKNQPPRQKTSHLDDLGWLRYHSNIASMSTMAKTWASSSWWVPKTGLRIGAAVTMLSMSAALLAPSAAAVDEFSDIEQAGVHRQAVEDLQAIGIFEGTECAPGEFCPDEPIMRWVAAVWIVRVLDGQEPPSVSASRFGDVDADEWWAAHIERLADLEITKGCAVDPAGYCPRESVTRSQMASFLARAFEVAGADPFGFTDIKDNVHAADIDAIAAVGITKGCDAESARYCPHDPVTRAQMASFLNRARSSDDQQEPTDSTEPTGGDSSGGSSSGGGSNNGGTTPGDEQAGVHRQAVEDLQAIGIFEGTECAPGEFCPDEPIMRWVAAVWIVRVLDGQEPPSVSASRFGDVDADEWWAAHIERLADLEITKGCAVDPAGYCPRESVTRSQMASFLARAFEVAGADPFGFTDIKDNVHAADIDAIAAVGITKGCDAESARYCPHDPVTRAQMASFLNRARSSDDQQEPTDSTEPTGGDSSGGSSSGGGSSGGGSSGGGSSGGGSSGGGSSGGGSNNGGTTPGDDAPGAPGHLTADPADGAILVSWEPPDDDGGSPITRYTVRWKLQAEEWGDDQIDTSAETRSHVIGELPSGTPYDIRVAATNGHGAGANAEETATTTTYVSGSATGRIAFTSVGSARGLTVMGADGTSVRSLTARADIRNPAWSPDGTLIAFEMNDADGDSEIFVMDSNGTNQQQVTDDDGDDTLPAWSPDGTKIAYARPGSIHIIDSDGTDGFKLANGSPYEPSWSPDGAKLAFTRSVNGDHHFFVIGADGSNEQQLTSTGVTSRDRPTWSPDGSRIAYAAEPEVTSEYGYQSSIFVMDLETSAHTEVVSGAADYYPAWSPDGSAIAFLRFDEDRYFQVFAVDPDGTNRRQLTNERNVPDERQRSVREMVWSPDSSKIGYIAQADRGTSSHVFVIDADGTDRTKFTDDGFDSGLDWSPGSRLVYVSDPDVEIFVADPDGTSVKQLTHNDHDDVDPVWSPDGSRLAYTATLGEDRTVLFAIKADGTNDRKLTNNQANSTQPAWSPDGTMIAYTHNDGTHAEIHIIKADGTNDRKLTNNQANSTQPAWSPDGTMIAYTHNDGTHAEIHIIKADGTNDRKLTNNQANSTQPAWSPDGTMIAYTRRDSADIEVYLVDVDGTDNRGLTDGGPHSFAPAWSPDGTQILFSQRLLWFTSILVAKFSDGAVVFNILGAEPAWSPDGLGVVYSANGDIFSRTLGESTFGESATRITNSLYDDGEPAWSAVSG